MIRNELKSVVSDMVVFTDNDGKTFKLLKDILIKEDQRYVELNGKLHPVVLSDSIYKCIL